jgi:16S rRNA (cytosine1402-N4)-methyltransferase
VPEHVPVLREEVLEALAVRADGHYLDGTFGRGGHTAAILERLGPAGRLVVIDRDPAAIERARAQYGTDARVRIMQGNFAEMQALTAQGETGGGFDGILLDLGVSSPQLDDPARGFSFRAEGPLDMRMDPGRGVSAADWLATVDEGRLADVLRRYGEERHARRIARAIVRARAEAPIETTTRLAGIVAAAMPGREPGKHPATRTFQAIRIEINGELDALAAALEQALESLAPGGRLCVISFHSLEDRQVKRFMRGHSREAEAWRGLPDMPEHARPRLRLVGRAVRPGEAEVAANPRARSAVLRVAERVR